MPGFRNKHWLSPAAEQHRHAKLVVIVPALAVFVVLPQIFNQVAPGEDVIWNSWDSHVQFSRRSNTAFTRTPAPASIISPKTASSSGLMVLRSATTGGIAKPFSRVSIWDCVVRTGVVPFDMSIVTLCLTVAQRPFQLSILQSYPFRLQCADIYLA